MPDYIQFPSGGDGNPENLPSTNFVTGQQIKCAVTATSADAVNSPLTVEAAAYLSGRGGIGLPNPAAQGWDSVYGANYARRINDIQSNGSSKLASPYAIWQFRSGTLGSTADMDNVITVGGVTLDFQGTVNWGSSSVASDIKGLSIEQWESALDTLYGRQALWYTPSVGQTRKEWLDDQGINYSDWVLNIDYESQIIDRISREYTAWAYVYAYYQKFGVAAPFYSNIIDDNGYDPATDNIFVTWEVDVDGAVSSPTLNAKGQAVLNYILNSIQQAKDHFGSDRVCYYNHPFRLSSFMTNKAWGFGTFTEEEWADYNVEIGKALAGVSYVQQVFSKAFLASTAYYTGYRYNQAPYTQTDHPRFYEAIFTHLKSGLSQGGITDPYFGVFTHITSPYASVILDSDVPSDGNMWTAFGATSVEIPFKNVVGETTIADPSPGAIVVDGSTPLMSPAFSKDRLDYIANLAQTNGHYVFGWISGNVKGNFNEGSNASAQAYRDSYTTGHDFTSGRESLGLAEEIENLGQKDGPSHVQLLNVLVNEVVNPVLGGSEVPLVGGTWDLNYDGNQITSLTTVVDSQGSGRWISGGTRTVQGSIGINISNQYPRLRDFDGGVLVDIEFESQAQRDSYINSVGEENLVLEVTNTTKLKTYRSMTVAELRQFALDQQENGLNPTDNQDFQIRFYLVPDLVDNPYFQDSGETVGLNETWTASDNFTFKFGTRQ